MYFVVDKKDFLQGKDELSGSASTIGGVSFEEDKPFG